MPRRTGRQPRAAQRGARSSARLVFEIGTEELPPAAAWEGARQLGDAAAAAFEAARIPTGELRAYSTSRRLVLIAEGVAARQQDLVPGHEKDRARGPRGHHPSLARLIDLIQVRL